MKYIAYVSNSPQILEHFNIDSKLRTLEYDCCHI